MAHLVLQRDDQQPFADRTLGRVSLFDDAGRLVWSGHSLERPWVDEDGDGLRDRRVSRIPAGTYTATPHAWDHAARFTRVWEIQDVPNGDAILFHALNFPWQTEGCVGLGEARADLDGDGRPDLAESRAAINALRNHVGRGDMAVTVIDGAATDPAAPVPFSDVIADALARVGRRATPHPPSPLPAPLAERSSAL